ncbi:MAG: hypothetical protein HZA46_02775 [Planctomycetales bacterium]|nr:hypothetical protein [Planctomycetales bacterium]
MLLPNLCRMLKLTGVIFVMASFLAANAQARGQGFVPGTGHKVAEVGDDFEDAAWEYTPNLPKASSVQDKNPRYPTGEAKNGRVFESAYRGQPDIVARVPTPAGGLPGSTGSLKMRSWLTGIPDAPSYKMQQDDLLVNGSGRLGYSIPVSWRPSFVVRVFMPPFEQWEKRSGSSFGLRGDCVTTVTKRDEKEGKDGRKISFGKPRRKQEQYWPGFFVQFNSKADGNTEDSAVFLIRSDAMGQDLLGPRITESGWWTLGMSFTPDGAVHYYASPGVDNLTPKDFITSQNPYGFRCETLNTFFFNICAMDNSKTWSTEWIVDDPSLYTWR